MIEQAHSLGSGVSEPDTIRRTFLRFECTLLLLPDQTLPDGLLYIFACSQAERQQPGTEGGNGFAPRAGVGPGDRDAGDDGDQELSDRGSADTQEQETALPAPADSFQQRLNQVRSYCFCVGVVHFQMFARIRQGEATCTHHAYVVRVCDALWLLLSDLPIDLHSSHLSLVKQPFRLQIEGQDMSLHHLQCPTPAYVH